VEACKATAGCRVRHTSTGPFEEGASRLVLWAGANQRRFARQIRRVQHALAERKWTCWVAGNWPELT